MLESIVSFLIQLMKIADLVLIVPTRHVCSDTQKVEIFLNPSNTWSKVPENATNERSFAVPEDQVMEQARQES